MRILLTNRPGGAFGFISDGWLNCLTERGHNVQRWNGSIATWQQFEPQLYIGASGHRQPIPANHNGCKIAIHVNQYGPMKTNVSESPDSIAWVTQQHPDVVFGYGKEEDRHLWSYWTERDGIPWAPMPTAGDAIVYKKDDSIARTVDVVWVGGRWKYKSITIDEFLLPVLADPEISSQYYGWGEWPDGVKRWIADNRVPALFQSGKVAPCISEPHTHKHGFDIPERVFKVILCGALAIHDSVVNIKLLIPSLVVAEGPKNFHNLCYYYSRSHNDAARIALAEQQRQEVLKAHTYHHRMATLFAALGLHHESKLMVS